jgi:hypothetical protein
MTKSNWRNELYLGERVGGAGTLVRQGIKIGGKKGGRAVQKGQTAAVKAGQGAKEKAKQGNQKKMVGSGKYEKAGALVGGIAGGLAGGVVDGPLPVGDIVGGYAGSKIGGKIGRQFDKREAEKKKPVGISTDVKKEETLLYDVVHNYIIAENFASDTEGANKIMLKLSDELMQEIYERMMTASEKRKDTMLKKKYDDSDMKKNMQAQYGKEEGKKVYFATIRKQAMKKEEVEVVNEVSSKTLRNYIIKGTKDVAKRASDPDSDSGPKYGKKMSRIDGVSKAADKLAKKASSDARMKEEVIPEAKYEAGASTYGKASIRNKRRFGTKGENPDPLTGKKITKDATRGELITKRREEHKAKRGMKEEVGITTHSMMMKDKAKKEAMLRMKERDAVAKKLRKEEVKRDEYGDPVGGPKISKKEKEKNLKKNTPDEQHTTTTSEGYGSDRVGPALTVARAIDKVNPRPKPNSKRTMASRALKMASIKKDEKIRKRQENPYSTDKKLKMVATSIRDRVRRKVKSMAANEDYIPEEGYDIARDMGRVRPSKDKKDGTTMPPSKEMMKTQKVNKGPSALEIVKKKYGKAVMDVKKK